jgi:UDP-N-acetylglucosamine transferase subunit ALG13
VIFVTVGGQIPFDRLVRGVDEWAGARSDVHVFAQIGLSELRPRNIDWTEFLTPEEFRQRVQSARALVAHAGMGSILTALEFGKPILVLLWDHLDALEAARDREPISDAASSRLIHTLRAFIEAA